MKGGVQDSECSHQRLSGRLTSGSQDPGGCGRGNAQGHSYQGTDRVFEKAQEERSVMHMACVTRRRNRWVLDFYDRDGKRCWKTMPKGATKAEANVELGKIEKRLRCGSYIQPSMMPLFEDVADQWLDNTKLKVRHTTLKGYASHIEVHLKPFFKGRKANEITIDMAERLISDLVKAKVYANTVRKIVQTLGFIMKYAAHPRRGYAYYNPIPDVENRPRKIETEADMASVEETQAIADEMPTLRDRLMVLLGALGGLRVGEIFGLQWPDIQWEHCQIAIRRTFNHGSFFPPKSKTSKRLVDVDKRFFLELKKWKLACPNSELNMVFPSRYAGPMSSRGWTHRVWHPARKRAGVRHLTPKSLRHLSGSYLLDQGEAVGYVQDHLGHSTCRLTMDTYRHKIKKHNQRAAEKLGGAFYDDGSKMVANDS